MCPGKVHRQLAHSEGRGRGVPKSGSSGQEVWGAAVVIMAMDEVGQVHAVQYMNVTYGT